MNARCLLMAALVLHLSLLSHAQQILSEPPTSGQITITAGTRWSDAVLRKSNLSSESAFANTNYNTLQRMSATAWTHSGQAVYYRNLLKFDLGQIPANSTVQSATLYLYADPAQTAGETSNQSQSGSNAIYFQKVTQSWNTTTVTWNTQPTTTTTGRLWLPQSASAIANITVDLYTFVQEWLNNPTGNYGLMMILENEAYHRSRNYASSDHATASLRPKLVINYTEPDPVKQRMDHVFGALNQADITTGILSDYGIDLADYSQFTGVLNDSNKLEMIGWRSLYGSLLSSVTNPSANLVHISTINQRLEDLNSTYDVENPIVDLPVLFGAYQTIKSTAISQNLLSISNERLQDVPNRTQSPYTTNYVFGATPAIAGDYDGNVTFALRSDLFVNSSSKALSSFLIDFGNGLGYQSMSLNTQKNVTYSTSGTKTIKFRAQFTDGSVYYSHANFVVMSIPSTGARYGDPEDNDIHRTFIFPRASDINCFESFPNPETWQGGIYGARVTIEYGNIGTRPVIDCNPQLIRPLIVLEGFDAFDDNRFADFTDPERASFTFNGLSDDLDNEGYDLIYVDWNEGTGDIVRNAYLVENIVRWVNTHKINNPATGIREQNVIMGISMGGLVGRYAACDMEKRRITNPSTNPNHEVRLLITHDSPHRGANVPLGFQAMVNELSDMKLTKLGLASYGVLGAVVGSVLTLKDIVPPLKNADQLLDKTASRQMLLVQDGRTNTFLDGEYRTMVTFANGYNTTFQIRATSNGSECGTPQNLIQSGGEVFYANSSFYINRGLYTLLMPLLNSLGTGYMLYQDVRDRDLKESLNNYIVSATLAALVPLTQKNWKSTFSVRAIPSSGTNLAFSGTISMEKKILFIVPINISLFNKSRNSISGTLPFDSAPGGYFNSSYDTPDNPNVNLFPIVKANLAVRLTPLFTFVPTFSALDIATSPVTTNVLYSPYTNGVNPTHPSRFENYFTQEPTVDRLGSINNTNHVRFTGRISDWLRAQILNPNLLPTGCSYLCGGFTITGPSSLCNSNSSTYSIAGINSPNTTVRWSSSNPAIVSINAITGLASVAAGAPNSTVTITAVIDGDCDDSPPITKSIAIGRPLIPSDITGPEFLWPGQPATYRVIPAIGTTSYKWIIPEGCYDNTSYYCWQSMFETDSYINVRTGDTGANVIEYQAINNCGYDSRSLFVTVSDECDYQLQVSPNPTSEEISVNIIIPPCFESVTATTTQDIINSQDSNNTENTITILSLEGQKEFSQKFSGNKLKVKNHGLKKGIHIMNVEHHDTIQQVKIVVD